MRIGIDLGGTKTEVIALDDAGEQRFRHRLPTPREDYQQLAVAAGVTFLSGWRHPATDVTDCCLCFRRPYTSNDDMAENDSRAAGSAT